MADHVNEFAEQDPDINPHTGAKIVRRFRDVVVGPAGRQELNLDDRQREILSSTFDLIEKLNDFITDTEESAGGPQGTTSLASFRHDAQTMHRILVMLTPLLACVTRGTTELIERESALTGVDVG